MAKKSPLLDTDMNFLSGRIQLLLKSPAFQEMILVCRRELGIPDDGWPTHEQTIAYIKEISDLIDDSKFTRYKTPIGVVEVIMRMFQIPEYYESFITFYFLQNESFPELISNSAVQIEQSKDKYGHPIINIQIRANTRKKDIEEKWKEVNKLQKDLVVAGNTKSMSNIERDVRILELKKQGYKISEIFQIINDEFPEDSLLEAPHVSTRLSRIKEYLGNIT